MFRKFDFDNMAKSILAKDGITESENPIAYKKYVNILHYALDCEYNKRAVAQLSFTIGWIIATVALFARILIGKNVFSGYVLFFLLINITAAIIGICVAKIGQDKAYNKLLELGYMPNISIDQ